MRIPTERRRVTYSGHGTSEVLDITSEPMPTPSRREVLVEVIAVGVNHIEALIRSGDLDGEVDSVFPQTQGTDFAGIVRAVGPDVRGVRKGMDVVGFAPRNAHSEWVCIDEQRVVPKPESLSWEVAGALYLAAVTALDTIDDLRISSADRLVVSAAAGGVGSAEAQMAKARGAVVIGTCGERNFDYLRQNGILPVVYGAGLADRIRDLVPDGVTAYIDNFGQDGEEVADALGVPAERYRSSEDRKRLELALIDPDPSEIPRLRKQLDRVVGAATSGEIALLVSGYYPFAHVRSAFDDLEHLHARGKIVLGTHPTSDIPVLKARDVHDARA